MKAAGIEPAGISIRKSRGLRGGEMQIRTAYFMRAIANRLTSA